MAKPVIEQIRSNLFRAEIPLPRNPLKATNSYIIMGESRNLVIDTGMNREECREALLGAFAELGVVQRETDYFITHLHTDHVGLAGEVSAKDAAIYFNQPDADILNHENLWELVCSLAGKHGFPEGEVEKAVEAHPGMLYKPTEPVNFTMLGEADILNYGGYELHCVVTPGHSFGHTCLYEPHLKLLFSGDHILGDITPNISTWLEDRNPLGQYLKSLDRVYAMDVDLVLPGHRSLITDCRRRIEELREHHSRRLDEVVKILEEKSPRSAFDVASEMTWELVADSWSELPLMQQWFATGEALAHLRYLEAEGEFKRMMIGGTLVFYTA